VLLLSSENFIPLNRPKSQSTQLPSGAFPVIRRRSCQEITASLKQAVKSFLAAIITPPPLSCKYPKDNTLQLQFFLLAQ